MQTVTQTPPTEMQLRMRVRRISMVGAGSPSRDPGARKGKYPARPTLRTLPSIHNVASSVPVSAWDVRAGCPAGSRAIGGGHAAMAAAKKQ
jgi:hypothetical protein